MSIAKNNQDTVAVGVLPLVVTTLNELALEKGGQVNVGEETSEFVTEKAHEETLFALSVTVH